jgi:serine O-acetyltransferase
MGVVIGETAEIGDDVLIYQGVVLGGTSLEKQKRHPSIESNVVIGAGAILLGPIRVESDARIGAGSVVIESVPAGATVVGVPGRSVEKQDRILAILEHAELPDPLNEIIRDITKEQEQIKQRLNSLEQREGMKV